MLKRGPFRAALAAAVLAMGMVAISGPGMRADGNPLEQIQAALTAIQGTLVGLASGVATVTGEVTHPTHGLAAARAALVTIDGSLAAVVSDVFRVKGEVTDPEHGLAQIQAKLQTVEEKVEQLTPSGPIRMSTGIVNSETTDTLHVSIKLVNATDSPQDYEITVYEMHPVDNTRTVLGTWSGTVGPGKYAVGGDIYPGPVFRTLEAEVQFERPGVVPSAIFTRLHTFGLETLSEVHPGDWMRLPTP